MQRRPWWPDELLTVCLVLLAAAPWLGGQVPIGAMGQQVGLPWFAALQRSVAAGDPWRWWPDLAGGRPAGTLVSSPFGAVSWLLLRWLPVLAAWRCGHVLGLWVLCRSLVRVARQFGCNTVGVAGIAAIATLGGATAAAMGDAPALFVLASLGVVVDLGLRLSHRDRPAILVVFLALWSAFLVSVGGLQAFLTAVLATLCLAAWRRSPSVSGPALAHRLAWPWAAGLVFGAERLLAPVAVPAAAASPAFTAGSVALLALAVARVAGRERTPATGAGLSLVAVGAALLGLQRLSSVPVTGAAWLLQLGVALLAGAGLTRLAWRRLPWPAAACGAAAAVGLALAGQVHGVAWLGVALAVLLVPTCRGAGTQLGWPARWILVGGLLELAVAWHTAVPAQPRSWFEPPHFARIIALSDNHRVLTIGLTPAASPADQRDRLEPNIGQLYGLSYLQDAAGLPAASNAVLRDIEQSLSASPSRFQAWLDRASVRWVITSRRLSEPSLRLAAMTAGARLYENTDARPRVYALDAKSVTSTGVRTLSTAPVRARPVKVFEHHPDRWWLGTAFKVPMAVVLSQSHDPGWEVWVDDRAAQVIPAEELFLATVVPAGRHVVEFRHRDRPRIPYIVGRMAWEAVWIVFCVGVIWHERRRRLTPTPP